MPRSRLGYAFIGSILNSLNQHGWDGIVLDAGFIHFRYPEKAARDSAIAFFGMVGEKIRAAGKKFILVIPVREIPPSFVSYHLFYHVYNLFFRKLTSIVPS